MSAQSVRWVVPLITGCIIVATASIVHFVLAVKDAQSQPEGADEQVGHAETMFHVSSKAGSLLSGEKLLGEDEYQRLCRTQAVAIKSFYVLNAALGNPEVARLAIVKKQPAEDLSAGPVWLKDALQVKFPDQGEMMVIELRLPGATPAESRTILDSIADAYQSEVVDTQRLQNHNRLEVLSRAHARLNQQYHNELTRYNELARELKLSPAINEAITELLLCEIELCERELLDLERRTLEIAAKHPTPDVKKLHDTVNSETDEDASDAEPDIGKVDAKAEPEVRLAASYARQVGKLSRRIAELKEQLETRLEPNADLEVKRFEIEQMKSVLGKLAEVRETATLDSVNQERQITLLQRAIWIEPGQKGSATGE